jgi:hypothetical protein
MRVRGLHQGGGAGFAHYLERFSMMLNRHCADPRALAARPRRFDDLVGRAAGESRRISRGRLRRNGAESGLDRSNRELPVLRLIIPCYLPVPSLLSANNLPVILLFRARRRAAPYFDNRLKRKIILAAG